MDQADRLQVLQIAAILTAGKFDPGNTLGETCPRPDTLFRKNVVEVLGLLSHEELWPEEPEIISNTPMPPDRGKTGVKDYAK